MLPYISRYAAIHFTKSLQSDANRSYSVGDLGKPCVFASEVVAQLYLPSDGVVVIIFDHVQLAVVGVREVQIKCPSPLAVAHVVNCDVRLDSAPIKFAITTDCAYSVCVHGPRDGVDTVLS